MAVISSSAPLSLEEQRAQLPSASPTTATVLMSLEPLESNGIAATDVDDGGGGGDDRKTPESTTGCVGPDPLPLTSTSMSSSSDIAVFSPLKASLTVDVDILPTVDDLTESSVSEIEDHETSFYASLRAIHPTSRMSTLPPCLSTVHSNSGGSGIPPTPANKVCAGTSERTVASQREMDPIASRPFPLSQHQSGPSTRKMSLTSLSAPPKTLQELLAWRHELVLSRLEHDGASTPRAHHETEDVARGSTREHRSRLGMTPSSSSPIITPYPGFLQSSFTARGSPTGSSSHMSSLFSPLKLANQGERWTPRSQNGSLGALLSPRITHHSFASRRHPPLLSSPLRQHVIVPSAQRRCRAEDAKEHSAEVVRNLLVANPVPRAPLMSRLLLSLLLFLMVWIMFDGHFFCILARGGFGLL